MLERNTTNCIVDKQVLWSRGSENLEHINTGLILPFFFLGKCQEKRCRAGTQKSAVFNIQ